MSQRKRIVIVGGVAGGASAAARLRRLSEQVEIVLFERGEHISFANCGMPYHIGGVIADRERLLVQTVQGMRQRYGIDVRTRTEVLRIDRPRKSVAVRNLQTGEESQEPYDALILSPGAEPVRPGVPGFDLDRVFTLRSLTDMDAIKRVVDRDGPERAVVIGGGYIGLEMTEALRERGVGVTLVELAPQVFVAADPEMVEPVHQQLRLHGVDLRLNTSVTGIRKEGKQLVVTLCDGQALRADLAILAIGVRPEVKLAKEAGLTIGETGAILVDEHMRTSDPDIYAVGDAVEVTHLVGRNKAVIPLAGPANRQGRIAADNIVGRPSTYKASQGTAICKVFDLAIGMTGMSEKALRKAGMRYEKVYVHSSSHASYYPGATPISLKLLFDPQTGRVLGGQGVGAEGVDKRIDVLAVAIRAGLTVEDLAEQELSYAPPYGSAKDPIHYAGFAAGNIRRGDMKVWHVDELARRTDEQVLLDVRTAAEVQAGAIPGAIHIPLDDLRGRLGELPKGKEILVYCQVGLRGYLACRILSQNGFACRNLSGGYKTYNAAMGTPPPVAAKKEMHSDAGAAPADSRTNGGTQASGRVPSGSSGDGGSCCGGRSAAEAQAPRASCCGGAASATQERPEVVRHIDATGLACPGPIMRLNEAIDAVDHGQAVTIVAGDPAFPRDVTAWCQSTGHRLLEIAPANGHCRATIVKGGQARTQTQPQPATAGTVDPKNKTIVLFSGDLDKALAAFIIANGAAAMGSKVTLFFTFWGIHILRRPERVSVRKSLIERMFGWMMPRGAGRLGLSRMHMGGLGTRMIHGIMRKHHVPSLPELIASAKKAGVRLVVCRMTMDLMGIRREELIDGVEEGGVATYLGRAETGNVNLFI